MPQRFPTAFGRQPVGYELLLAVKHAEKTCLIAAERARDPQNTGQASTQAMVNTSQQDERRAEGGTEEGAPEHAEDEESETGDAHAKDQWQARDKEDNEALTRRLAHGSKDQGAGCHFSSYSPYTWVLSLNKVCARACICVLSAVYKYVCARKYYMLAYTLYLLSSAFLSSLSVLHVCLQMRAGGVWRVGICLPDAPETEEPGDTHTTGTRAIVRQGRRANPANFAPDAALSRTDEKGGVQGDGSESEGGKGHVDTALRGRKYEDGYEAWTQDDNWNDRRAKHRVWYLDSNGDVFSGAELLGETNWQLVSSDLIAVTLAPGANKLVWSTVHGSYGVPLDLVHAPAAAGAPLSASTAVRASPLRCAYRLSRDVV